MKKHYNPDRSKWESILKRPTQTFEDIEDTVQEVFREVKAKGDRAVAKYTSFFDGVKLEDVRVSQEEIETSTKVLKEDLKNAIQLAKTNITNFHQAQQTPAISVETTKGVKCWQDKRPIQRVGLYIPGGSAPLFSTILMLAVPAQLAGCEKVLLCTPPNSEGKVDPAILYTANLCGIDTIYKVGGIQAIAAMTFGTEDIPQVFKIFGPGNQYVTVAKQYATRFGIAIDMPAGPSELLVLADGSAIPSFVASDLLSQAEHGADSQVILVSTDKTLIEEVEKEIEEQLPALPRKTIVEKTISNSKIIYFNEPEEVISLVNLYGPEHLIIVAEEEEYYLDRLKNAGSVFLGSYTPESAGDYASGTNHTLPTNGYARSYSGVNLDSFMKTITFQRINPKGIKKIGPAVELMAEAEGLQAHSNAITLRLNQLKNKKN